MGEGANKNTEVKEIEQENTVDRRQFLAKWSKIVAGAVIVGGAAAVTSKADEIPFREQTISERDEEQVEAHYRCGWRCGYRCGGWRCGGWRCGGWRCGGWRCGGWRCGYRCYRCFY